MEFPTVGKLCQLPDCKQLDYLPITCKCGQIFCTIHFNEHVMTCTHDNQVEDLKRIETLTCEYPDCKTRSVLPITCGTCGKKFCVVHRHTVECELPTETEKAAAIEKMKIPIAEFNKQKALVDKQLDITLANAMKKEKKHETACKVNLLRLKNKAVGSKSIPTADRVYFSIRNKDSDVDKPVFVSKAFTLGRALDSISDSCGIRNENHLPNKPQLRLFKAHETILSTDLSVVLNDMLNDKVIRDGETLILKHVND